MKVRIIDDTVAVVDGRATTVTVGQVLDLPESDVRTLLQAKRAMLYEESVGTEPEEATDRAAVVALDDARGRTGRKAGR